MINAVGRVGMGGTLVGDSERERVGFVGEVKTRQATEEELNELEKTFGKPKSERACLRRMTAKEEKKKRGGEREDGNKSGRSGRSSSKGSRTSKGRTDTGEGRRAA